MILFILVSVLLPYSLLLTLLHVHLLHAVQLILNTQMKEVKGLEDQLCLCLCISLCISVSVCVCLSVSLCLRTDSTDFPDYFTDASELARFFFLVFFFLPPETPSSLASFKSRLDLPFWYRLTQVALEKRPLNGCGNSSWFRAVD